MKKKLFFLTASLFVAVMSFAQVPAITFTAASGTGTLEDSTFTADNLILQTVDPSHKMSIDANTSRFGDDLASAVTCTFRLKTGGKTNADVSQNYLKLTAAEAGQLIIGVRTGKNSDTDRTLVITQNGVELFNQPISESMKVEEEDGNYYTCVKVNVEAGEIILSYPVNGLNFYYFALKVPKLYVIGSNQPGGWAANVGTQLTMTESGVYTYEAYITGETYFAFVTELANDNDSVAWNYVNNRRYGADENDKVIANGDIVDLAQGQNAFKISQSGYYTITVNFNTMKVSVASIPAKVEIMCGWNEWTPVLMENVEGDLAASCTINLAPGYYSGAQGFKVRVNDNDTWYGNNWYMDRTNCSEWEFNDEVNNCGLVADVAGNYTFTYVYATGKVSVAYPESFTREAATTNYQSLCVPFNATISNATVYDVTAMSNTTISLTEHEGNMVAGHAYIIKPVEADADVVITKVGEEAGVAYFVNELNGANGLYGFLTNSTDGVAYQYAYDANWAVYILLENQFHLISEGASATIGSTKAYLHYAAPAGAPATLNIIEGENGATGIENIETNDVAVKFIKNGQLFIRKNGIVYDATGAIVR